MYKNILIFNSIIYNKNFTISINIINLAIQKYLGSDIKITLEKKL